jgi:cell wall-associated NlpC family hydrolase
MKLRLKLLLIFSLALSLAAFSGAVEAKKISLGRVAQATQATKIYSRPSTRSHVYYSIQPNEYLVVRDYKKDSPWKLVLLQNMSYGYARRETMQVLNYEYKVDAPQETPASALASLPRASKLSSRSYAGARAAVAQASIEFKGTPYVWGGNDLQNGIDCSGFIKQLYGKIGVNLPRTAAEQVNVGRKITRLEDLQPGDRLYFWDYKRNCVGHTGIYYGGGYFVHSSRTHRGVDKDYLGDPKWMRLLVAARR